MEDVTWGALTLTLSLVGALWTWLSIRRHGVVAGLRPAAFTLLPAAAYLTGTLQMFTRIADAVASWATSLVFNPFVWVGVVLAGVSGLLFVASGILTGREGGHRAVPAAEPKPKLGRARSDRGEPAIGSDEDAEIEALLRRHGIS